MRTRWLTAVASLGLAAGGPAVAQDARPVELPPLLTPVPAAPCAPCLTPAPGGPRTAYDHNLLYLPDTNPGPPPVVVAAPPPVERWWLGASLELGQTRNPTVPPLVFSGANGGTALGATLYGGEKLPLPFRGGLGLNAGLWFDDNRVRGVDGSLYSLGNASAETIVSADALHPAFVRFTDGAAGVAYLSLAPTNGTGSFRAYYESRFASADVNFRRNLAADDFVRVDALVGYRYAYVGDELELAVRQDAGGFTVRTADRVTVDNDFHGGQIGLAGELRGGRWFADATGKVAFGTTFTRVGSAGALTVNGASEPFGFYTRPANAVPREVDGFGVMPTVNARVGRRVGENTRVWIGYNFQYLSRVGRAADALDPSPDITGLGTRREVRTADFWAQSVSLGVDVRY